MALTEKQKEAAFVTAFVRAKAGNPVTGTASQDAATHAQIESDAQDERVRKVLSDPDVFAALRIDAHGNDVPDLELPMARQDPGGAGWRGLLKRNRTDFAVAAGALSMFLAMASIESCVWASEDREAGYAWAEDNLVTDAKECRGETQSFVDGCRAFVDEQL